MRQLPEVGERVTTEARAGEVIETLPHDDHMMDRAKVKFDDTGMKAWVRIDQLWYEDDYHSSDYCCTSVKIGQAIIDCGGAVIHVDEKVRQSHQSEDGCIEILDDRPIKFEYGDSDYWLDLKEES